MLQTTVLVLVSLGKLFIIEPLLGYLFINLSKLILSWKPIILDLSIDLSICD